MPHFSIFLFCTGLVQFLFPINDEVVYVILVVVSIFAAQYIILTCLPLVFRQCPFQTPLTTILWHIGHILVIASLFLFARFNYVQVKIKKLWN